MQTTTEILSVNGTVLNTLAKNIDTLTGRLRAPAYRTGNITIPGAHGDLWVPDKRYQPNSIALPMWVQGVDDDGAIPSGVTERAQFFANVNTLVGIFKTPGALLDVRWTQPDGSVRQCYAEAADVFDFTVDAAPKGLVGVVLTLPYPFWQDTASISTRFIATNTTIAPVDWQGSTAPVEDMVYLIEGPWTNPGLQFWDGSWWQYNAAIPAGETLTVDSGEWTLTGSTGVTVDYSKMTHDGADGVWGTLPPVPAAAPDITLLGSGRTTASGVTLTGHRKFLIG